jgi:2'-5' RNA ligase
VADLAQQAQQRLASLAASLHMTPHEWLHITTLIAGPAASFSGEQLQRMTRTAARLLANVPPVTVTLGRVFYHPEAIKLGVAPAHALLPIHDAASQATQLATGIQEINTILPTWTPHITICYSIADQPAQPLINALGLQLPSCDIQVSALSLVLQHGPERTWDWTSSTPSTSESPPGLSQGQQPYPDEAETSGHATNSLCVAELSRT